MCLGTFSVNNMKKKKNRIKMVKNRKFQIETTLINLCPNYTFIHCRIAVKIYRYIGSCNILNDLSNKVSILKQNRRFKYNCVQHDYRNK